ncbi:G5 domain-containing protein [Actinoplanes sp. NPDC049599]|uniref:G5 domain-containing protein n=1 Tax=Actinoplanes sp. NPDC049599 TaxID=3363903 RepID=UPI0037B7551A
MATAGLGVLALVAGTAGGIAALTSNDTRVVTAVGQAAPVVDLPAAEVPVQPPAGQTGLGSGTGAVGHAQAEREADETRSAPGEADRTATRTPRRPASVPRDSAGAAAVAPGVGAAAAGPGAAVAPAGPQIRTGQVSETEAIPFRTTLVRDPALPRGSREIRTPGAPGERLLRYEVTYTGDRETSRRLLDSAVTREPRNRVVAVGTRGRGDRPGADHGKDRGRGHDRPDRPDRPGRHDRPDRDCRLLGSCVQLDHGTECTDGDKFDARHEGIIDGDLSLLDPSDIDELELTLPCEDEPDDADWAEDDADWDDGDE